MKFHWIYRDFVKANDMCKNDNLWFECIKRNYIYSHWELLSNIHFIPKGFSKEEEVISKIKSLGKSYYEKLLTEIKKEEEFENKIIMLTKEILNNFEYRIKEKEIYVIIGLGVTNIYSTRYKGQDVTVICLEFLKDELKKIKFLLSHECHHWVRQSLLNNNIFDCCIGERLVTEGLASRFTSELYPGFSISEYCYVPQKTVEWVVNHFKEIEENIKNNLYSNDLEEELFSRNPSIRIINKIPKRSGYVFGFLKVDNYIKRVKKNSVDIVDLKWEKIMNG